MIRWFLTCALLGALAPCAVGADLLATVNRVHGGGDDTPWTSIRSIAIQFGYDISPTGPACNHIRVGCEPIPIAQAVDGAVFECGPANQHFVRGP